MTVLGAVLVLSLAAPAPATPDCLDLVRRTYAHLSRPAEDDAVYRLQYTVDTVRRGDGPGAESRSTVEVLLDRNQVRLTSPELIAYQDEEMRITILPRRKIVEVGPSTLELQRQRRLEGLALFQTKLFDAAVVRSCEALPGEPAAVRVVLAVDEAGAVRFPMRQIAYDVDTSGERVRRVLMEYPDTHPLVRVEITFEAIDYDFETHALEGPVRRAVFDAEGNLLAPYAGFEVREDSGRPPPAPGSRPD